MWPPDHVTFCHKENELYRAVVVLIGISITKLGGGRSRLLGRIPG